MRRWRPLPHGSQLRERLWRFGMRLSQPFYYPRESNSAKNLCPAQLKHADFADFVNFERHSESNFHRWIGVGSQISFFRWRSSERARGLLCDYYSHWHDEDRLSDESFFRSMHEPPPPAVLAPITITCVECEPRFLGIAELLRFFEQATTARNV